MRSTRGNNPKHSKLLTEGRLLQTHLQCNHVDLKPIWGANDCKLRRKDAKENSDVRRSQQKKVFERKMDNLFAKFQASPSCSRQIHPNAAMRPARSVRSRPYTRERSHGLPSNRRCDHSSHRTFSHPIAADGDGRTALSPNNQRRVIHSRGIGSRNIRCPTPFSGDDVYRSCQHYGHDIPIVDCSSDTTATTSPVHPLRPGHCEDSIDNCRFCQEDRQQFRGRSRDDGRRFSVSNNNDNDDGIRRSREEASVPSNRTLHHCDASDLLSPGTCITCARLIRDSRHVCELCGQLYSAVIPGIECGAHSKAPGAFCCEAAGSASACQVGRVLAMNGLVRVTHKGP